MTFANPFPASAYLLRKERRHRYRTTSGAIDSAALSVAKRLLPTTNDVTQKQRDHLLRVVDRIEKAAIAWAALADDGLLDERFGFPIVIEVPNGGMRRGISDDGILWESKLEGCAYGFLLDTVARDAEEIDVIVGPDQTAADVYVIAQMIPPGPSGTGGELDEYKLAIGFGSYEQAEQCYATNWGRERVGQILTMPLEVLRGLLGFELDEGIVTKALDVVAGGNSVLAIGPNGVVVGRVEKLFSTAKVATERYAHIDFSPPEGVREAARRGLALHEEGKTGDGIEPATVAWARRIADGEAVSPEKARQGNRWFGRNERFKDEPKDSPAWAAWMLWFGEDGKSWFSKLVEQMDAADQSAKEVDGTSTGSADGQSLPQQSDVEEKAIWSTAEINTRPDSAFLYIEPGGEKDAEGKTVPRTLRHFVYRDGAGDIDLPHLRNAIARAPQANLPKEVIAHVQEEARRLLEEATSKAFDAIATVKLCAIEKGVDMATPIDRRIVYGIALEPEPFGGRGDAHDETYSADVIRRAAYGWLASFATFDDSHGRFLTNQEIVPVESFIAPCDFVMNGSAIRSGSWVVAAKICSDALWQRILNGELNAWSIEGHAVRECGRCAAALVAKKMGGGVKWLCPACDRSQLLVA